MRTFSTRLPALVAAVAASLAYAPLAHAQTAPQPPSVTGLTVARVGPDGAPVDAGNVAQGALSRSDCEAGLSLLFDLSLSSVSASYAIAAWAGTQDCTELPSRQNAATAVCWPVAVGGLQPTSTSWAVDVRVQDIASQAWTQAHSVVYSPATEGACTGIPEAGATALTLYFFFVDSQGNPVGTAKSFPVSIANEVTPATIPGNGGENGVLNTTPKGCSVGPPPQGSSGAVLGFGVAALAVSFARARRRRGRAVLR